MAYIEGEITEVSAPSTGAGRVPRLQSHGFLRVERAAGAPLKKGDLLPVYSFLGDGAACERGPLATKGAQDAKKRT